MQALSAEQKQLVEPRIANTRLSQAILWVTLGSLFLIPLLFSYFDIVAVYGELRKNLLHFAAGLIATMWL